MTIQRTMRAGLTALVAVLMSGCAAASELKDRAEDAAREAAGQAVEREVGERADEAVSGAFDRAEDEVRCVAGDDACIEEARDQGRPVVVTDGDGAVVEKIPASSSGGGAGVASGYDFQPGDRVLFETDFAGDNLGDFPRSLEFVDGNWDVVEWRGRRALRNTGPRGAAFEVPLPETLPERFTIEFETWFQHGNQQIAVATVAPERGRVNRLDDVNYFHLSNAKSGVASSGDAVESLRRLNDVFAEGPIPVRIMVDGRYAKVYVGRERVANVPNAVLPRSRVIWFENTYFADGENPIYIAGLRIAAGGRDLYEALQRDGRVTVRGILFDTGSSQIRRSSSDVLEEIAGMLESNPGLRLRIEGHTDSEGAEAANRRLSQARAESVMRHLVGLGIDAGRLEAVGRGEAEPVASNETAEGRQQNRRVELVRI